MQRILVTGKSGYLANHIKQWLGKAYKVDLISLKNNDWKSTSFENYDCIIHTAALVHEKKRKYSKEDYIKINTDLTKELAGISKAKGVKHFIFISSSEIYGGKQSMFKSHVIDKNTVPNPKTNYGISKYMAEQQLKNLESDSFCITIVRPPMVYGHDCPGNFLRRLIYITEKVRIVPKINSKRSMIYVDNLCECIRLIIEKKVSGVINPQNQQYVSTTEMSKLIAKYSNIKVHLSTVMIPFVYAASLLIPKFRTAFGNEYYEMDLSQFSDGTYCVVDFEQSVQKTIRP
jgi:UDP-glucose 4-epimerase